MSGLTNPNATNVTIPVVAANITIAPIGFTRVGIFAATYAITIAGNAIAIKRPATMLVDSIVFSVNEYIPNPSEIEAITKTVAFALLLVDTPPSKIPAAKKINPINIVRPVRACIPSMKVCAKPI